MSWNNAPTLNKLTASQQGGNRGAQLWGVDLRGKLYTTYQTTPGGDWSNWLGPDWAGPNYPKQVFELAASQVKEGRTQFWALDTRLQLWSTWQNSPGGTWSAWQQNWNPSPGKNKFKKIAASAAGGGAGAYFFGIFENGALGVCNQMLPAGNWSPWTEFRATPKNSRWIEVAACQQHDGRVALWGLDTERQLWSCWQESPGGGWGGWQGPNWKDAPRLRNHAAVRSYSGSIVFGQDEHYGITALFQNSPASPHWTGWLDNWMGGPPSYELAVAGQNNDCVHIWVITLKQKLSGFGQVPPHHGWHMGWSDRDDDGYPTPPQPKPDQPKPSK
jgi:hypothetical protein